MASNNGPEPHALCPFGFQGLLHDEATGNLYQRLRIWHPLLGKFIQRDPLGYPDGLNAYAGYHVMWGGVDPMGQWVAIAVRVVITGGKWVWKGGKWVWKKAVGKSIPKKNKPNATGPKPNKPKSNKNLKDNKTRKDQRKHRDGKDKNRQKKKDEKCDQKKCLPCIPPVGSVVWDVDRTGPAHNGIKTPHSHKLVVNQNPKNCQCFFKRFRKPIRGIMQPEWVSGGSPGGGGFAP